MKNLVFLKLDGVGPVDNRPSTDKLQHFVKKKKKKSGIWHMTCDARHVTCDTWHVTCDMLWGWTFSQNFCSLALMVCDLWYLADWGCSTLVYSVFFSFSRALKHFQSIIFSINSFNNALWVKFISHDTESSIQPRELNIAPREYTVQNCPFRKGNKENQLVPYYPTLYDNREQISKYS